MIESTWKSSNAPLVEHFHIKDCFGKLYLVSLFIIDKIWMEAPPKSYDTVTVLTE